MDKDALKEALDEMRKDMRGRVGRKLLSVEVHSHADHHDDGDAQPGDDDDEQKKGDPATKMGLPLI